MSDRIADRVFEFTWREQRPWDDEDGVLRTVRIVAVNDHKGRLEELVVEEMGKDALGCVQWDRTDHCYLPERVLAELLIQTGHLSSDEDLSCL